MAGTDFNSGYYRAFEKLGCSHLLKDAAVVDLKRLVIRSLLRKKKKAIPEAKTVVDRLKNPTGKRLADAEQLSLPGLLSRKPTTTMNGPASASARVFEEQAKKEQGSSLKSTLGKMLLGGGLTAGAGLGVYGLLREPSPAPGVPPGGYYYSPTYGQF